MEHVLECNELKILIISTETEAKKIRQNPHRFLEKQAIPADTEYCIALESLEQHLANIQLAARQGRPIEVYYTGKIRCDTPIDEPGLIDRLRELGIPMMCRKINSPVYPHLL